MDKQTLQRNKGITMDKREEFLRERSARRLVDGDKWMSFIESREKRGESPFLVFDEGKHFFDDFREAYSFFTKTT